MIVVKSKTQSKFDQEYIEKLILSKQKNIVAVNPEEFELLSNSEKTDNNILAEFKEFTFVLNKRIQFKPLNLNIKTKSNYSMRGPSGIG